MTIEEFLASKGLINPNGQVAFEHNVADTDGNVRAVPVIIDREWFLAVFGPVITDAFQTGASITDALLSATYVVDGQERTADEMGWAQYFKELRSVLG